MVKKLIGGIILLLIFSMVMTGCSKGGSDGVTGEDVKSQDATSEAVKDERNNVVLISPPPDTLDPQNTDATGGLRILGNVHESLVKFNEANGEFDPWVAEKWDISGDGMEYTFYLAKGNKFHNGNELTADDVKFTFERAMSSPFTMNYMSPVENISVVDDYTVRIVMKYAYSPFMNYISMPNLGILNREVVEKEGDAYGRNPIGSGPYKFVNWASGEHVDLEAYEDYHLGEASIKKVTIKFIQDRTTQVIALKKGEADILYEIPPMEKAGFVENSEFGYYEMVASFIDYLVINNEVTELKDLKVRQAIAKVINYNDVLEAYAGGNGIVPDTHIPPGTFGVDESIKRHNPDLEEAKALLAEAGYADGFETKIMVNNEDANICAQVIQANLQELNIRAEIELYEVGTFYEKQTSGDYEILINGYEFPGGDADTGLYPQFHSRLINSKNASRYNNPKVDKLLDEARVAIDRSKRKELYSEISKILHDDMPIIPLDIPYIGTAYNAELDGVTATQLGFMYFSDWSWK